MHAHLAQQIISKTENIISHNNANGFRREVSVSKYRQWHPPLPEPVLLPRPEHCSHSAAVVFARAVYLELFLKLRKWVFFLSR